MSDSEQEFDHTLEQEEPEDGDDEQQEYEDETKDWDDEQHEDKDEPENGDYGQQEDEDVGNDEESELEPELLYGKRDRIQDEVLAGHTEKGTRAKIGQLIPSFDKECVDPSTGNIYQVNWQKLAEYMAKNRTLLFFTFLYYCKTDLQNWLIDIGAEIVGGTTKVQDVQVGTSLGNPKYTDPNRNYKQTQYSHFVEADIKNVASDDWPDFLKRLLAATRCVPTCWNLGIDRSIDHIQQEYIEEFKKTNDFDKDFVKAFLDDVIKRIESERGVNKWQYSKMYDEDIENQLATFQRLKEDRWLDRITKNEGLPDFDDDDDNNDV